MTHRMTTSILRFLLVVLLGTYMSPTFAWQMIDSHSEMSPALIQLEADHHEYDLYHHHHHHHDDGTDDDSAHTQIGHLLSHLPAVVSDDEPFLPTPTGLSGYPVWRTAVAFAASDPPYKPPRNSFT